MSPPSSTAQGAPAASPRWLARHLPSLVVALVVVLLTLVRLRLADVPLERDEGEYAYAGQLIRDGIPPYRLAYNMKFPGIYYAYAALMTAFGETPRGIRLGLALVNGATIGLLFVWARRLLGSPLAGAVAAIAYGVLSIDQRILGPFAHATHFVVLFAVAGLLLVVGARESGGPRRWVLGGFALGLSVLMKQNGAFFLALGAGLALRSAVRSGAGARFAALRAPALVAAGSAIPLAAVAALLAGQGVFDAFWLWTIDYARAYVSEVPWQEGGSRLAVGFSQVTRDQRALWTLAAVGLACASWADWVRAQRAGLLALVAVSFAAVCPGLYFRSHYFILALPAAAILVGVAVESVRRTLAGRLPPAVAWAGAIGLFALATGSYLQREWPFLVATPPGEISRARYGMNPFDESPEIARQLAARTRPGDAIMILGSEPQIYFLADRRSASGYIYMYPLVERHAYAERMQTEMIEEVERARPAFVVFVAVPTSWQANEPRERIILWADRFLKDCYERVGVVDVMRSGPSTFVWDEGAAGYVPRSERVVLTFRRKLEGECPSSTRAKPARSYTADPPPRSAPAPGRGSS